MSCFIINLTVFGCPESQGQLQEEARKLFARIQRVEGAVYFARLLDETPSEDPAVPDINVLATWSFVCNDGDLVLEVAAGIGRLRLEAEEAIQCATNALHLMVGRGARELLLYPADETTNTVFRHDGPYGGPLVSMAVDRHIAEQVGQAAKTLG